MNGCFWWFRESLERIFGSAEKFQKFLLIEAHPFNELSTVWLESATKMKKKLLKLSTINSDWFTYSEAATGDVLSKKMFLKISQNSQENTCARVSFLIKLQAFTEYWWLLLTFYITTNFKRTTRLKLLKRDEQIKDFWGW